MFSTSKHPPPKSAFESKEGNDRERSLLLNLPDSAHLSFTPSDSIVNTKVSPTWRLFEFGGDLTVVERMTAEVDRNEWRKLCRGGCELVGARSL